MKTKNQQLARAKILLNAVYNFININDLEEYLVFYDNAECDGGCLAEECKSLAEDINEN